MTQDPDLLLARLLATPERPADDLFVLKVRSAVAAEERLLAARRAGWRRLLVEMSGAATALLVFALLAAQSPELAEGMVSPTGPAAVGILLLALWLVVTSRSEASST